ncbi:uncharacterized protein LOC116186067 [Apis dorsata]|uniref:uncharacterized protein LOC116186067 n=1 Tax=Apis dorsata TaxID=7462 RepID=UPI001293B4C0|nr:uncharacterized protein LOC116186067 [Apis dorsata]
MKKNIKVMHAIINVNPDKFSKYLKISYKVASCVNITCVIIFIVIGIIKTEILKLSRELNQAYTYQILLDIILQFSLLLCILYNTYFYLISLNLSEVFLDKEISVTIIWISLLSAKIILINNHCTNFYREVEITAHLLRELDICYLDNSIRNEVLQFSLQLFLHPLKFTAGDYILNNRLSTMIFSTIITYLILLVQLSPLLVR